MKITVTTPTGNIGSKLASRLLERGAEVTVIARNPEKVKDLAARGATVITGDQADAAVLQRALQGADALFWLTPYSPQSHDPLEDYRRFADIVSAAVSRTPALHVVGLSSIGANLTENTGPIRGLHYMETQLRSATKNFTALRPNYFMENLFAPLPTILSEGSIYSVTNGSARLRQVATADIAAAAADALLARREGTHVIDVAGPEDVSFDRAAEVVSSVIGKAVRHVTVPPDAFVSAATGAGLSPEVAWQLVELDEAINAGLGEQLVGDVQRYGEVTLERFVRETFLPAYRQASEGTRRKAAS